jgi:hypothetical protein
MRFRQMTVAQRSRCRSLRQAVPAAAPVAALEPAAAVVERAPVVVAAAAEPRPRPAVAVVAALPNLPAVAAVAVL